MNWNTYRSFNKPDTSVMDNNGTQSLIDELKQAIDEEKLKEIKSSIAKLKLVVNDDFPMFTQDTANFGAYLYAVNNNKSKAADSLLTSIMKKNYTYDVFPLATFLKNLSRADIGIIFNVLDAHTQWNLSGTDVIDQMFKEYPKETEKFIIAGRLNKFAAGENRKNTAIQILKVAGSDACISTLKTFFGAYYVEKYGIQPGNLYELVDIVDSRSQEIKIKTRKEYFYKIGAKAITLEMLEKDNDAGLLDDECLKIYTEEMFKSYLQQLIKLLNLIKNDELRVKLVGAHKDVTEFVAKNHPHLLPKSLQDILFF